MGVKVGRFMSVSGTEYEVRLTGETVVGGDIALGVPPVVISMAEGEHKFVGFKSTTATVNIVTNVALTDLYASTPRSILLEVENVTDGTVEYEGWVAPFAFDQPLTGCNDVVTVNAVDRLSAMATEKYVSYGGQAHGTDVSALIAIRYICGRAGITKLATHLNFNGSSLDVMAQASPLDVKVAQAGFLQDEVSDVDALSAIAKFFGYTAHVVGDTMWMYDEHAIIYADAKQRANVNVYHLANIMNPEHYFNDASSPMADNAIGEMMSDVQVSVERAYDGVAISVEGSSTSVLLRDVCQHMVADGDAVTLQEYDEKKGVDYMQTRSLKRCVDMEIAEWPADAVTSDSWTGAMPLRVLHMNRSREDFDDGAGKRVMVKDADARNYIMMRAGSGYATVGVQRDVARYSHTNGYVAVHVGWRYVLKDEWQRVDTPTDGAGQHYLLGVVSLHNGAQRLWQDLSGTSMALWTSGDGPTSFPAKDYEVYPTGQAQRIALSKQEVVMDWIVATVNDGQVYVKLGVGPDVFGAWAKYFVLYIGKLEVVGYGDEIDTDCMGLRDKWGSGDELLNASTMLTTRHATYDSVTKAPIGTNARPCVAPYGVWSAGYMGRKDTENMEIAGVMMEQLKARYKQPRTAYTMAVVGKVMPYQAQVWDGKRYTVESYDRDLYDDVTTIKIN